MPILDFTEEQLLGITALPSIFSIFLYHLLQLAYPLTPLAFQRSNLLAPPKTTIGPKFNIDTPISTRRNTKAYALSLLATTQAIAWIIVAVAAALERDWQTAIGKALASLAWIYAAISPLARPPTTPPWLLLAVYIFHLVAASFAIISLWLHPHLRTVSNFIAVTLTFLTCTALIGIASTYPLVAPTGTSTDSDSDQTVTPEKVQPESPEDKLNLFAWVTFTWVESLLRRSKLGKLEYSDIWTLPPVMQAAGVRSSASAFSKTRLIPFIFHLNSLDLTLSLSLGLTGSVLSYSAPYFLKEILTALSNPDDPSQKKSAYIYASLALAFQILRAELDLIQLWHERRAILRTRSCLTGMVYEKALKRRDGSGVITTETEVKAPGGGKGLVITGIDRVKKVEAKPSTKPEKKTATGGSTGKIVQLMSGDSMRLANQLMSLSSFFAAPVELVIAITFLYQLLGWTCIAGLSCMLLSLPLNHILVKRRIKIHRSVLASRDTRMNVLNEFIQAIRFIKYSASEEDWLKRVFSARTAELAWLLKTRLNSLCINVIWNFTPDLISLISFICFTKILKQDLTVPIAFTSLALFALVRGPLNSLPSQITGFLETYVSVQRLETFFDEPEVENWVSGLRDEPHTSEKVGIEDGRFKYQDITTKSLSSATAPSPLPGVAKPITTTSTSLLPVAVVAENVEDTETTQLIPAAEEVAVEDAKPVFELNISVDFPIGGLTIIVGATGSGKTSLFLALLGEMDCISGKVNLSKDVTRLDSLTGLYDGVAYCSQLPWLQGDTIKANICFGSLFDQERYEEVLDVCALRVDLAMFPAGDLTEIGEKGITLSGGQKARIALARAVYSRAKTVLLDDPLAAVDMGTARHLYDNCLKGNLMNKRTIILATHHLSLALPGADYLVKIASGQVAHQGYVNTLDRSIVAWDLLDEKNEISPVDAVVDIALPTDGQLDSGAVTRIPSPVAGAGVGVAVGKDVKKTVDGKLIEEEVRATGRVKTSVYMTYLTAAGLFTWVVILGLIIIGRVFRLGDRYWFKVWGESYRSASSLAVNAFYYASSVQSPYQLYFASSTNSGASITGFLPDFPSASDNVDFYLIVYAGICIANVLISVLVIIAGYYGSFRAARILFTRTLTTVAHAPFRYWDTTPTGRILNRFSADFAIIDSSLTDQVRVVLTQALSFVVNVLVIIFVSPAFVPPAILIIFLYVRLSISYVRASRDLRRLESNARSPIYSKFGETLTGIAVVRAFSAERRMLQGLFDSVDKMLSCHYASAMTNRYLLFRFDILGAIAVAFTTYLSLSAGASPGLAALAITSAQSLVSSVYWLCRWISALEVDLNAVERVTELLETPQEPAHIVESKRPAAIWPSSTGGITFDNLTLAYAPHLPAVIKGVSFDVLPREKVGIVGRTGSGKSTLGMSFFRLVEASAGSIVIDGIDISSIGLADLRSQLTLIPQEAVLFSGTVRSNIDQFDEYTDGQCLEVLERVEMNSSVSTRGSGTATPVGRVPVEGEGNGRMGVSLDTAVSQGGNNFSAGQRQLLALARALLRRRNVIVMDEATASVDFETDAKIQRTIREDFSDAIVFCIAHRLRTIIDYDKVLVLDAGNVAEYDSPRNLLLREGSSFRKMCEQAADWEELKVLAGL